MIILREENQDLRGKLFPIPDGVRKHLRITLNDYEERNGNKNNDGYDRLVYLCDQERITMEELKRIKNFFDNYNGTPKSDDYILNGGKPMSDWVNRILKVATDTSKNEKEAKELMGLDDKKQRKKNDTPKVEKLKLDKIQTKNLSNSISKNSVVKESKTFYITERQLSLIKEALNPETFSFEKLDELCKNDAETQESTAYKYCVSQLGEPSGVGSDRAVFDLTDDTVLKLEFSGQGQMQNSHEYEMTKQVNDAGINIVTGILKYSDEFNWMVCERAVPCRINDFAHILGVPFLPSKKIGDVNDKDTKEFGNHTEYPFERNMHVVYNKNICVDGFISHIVNKGKYTFRADDVAYNDLMQNNEWFSQLAKLIKLTGTEDLHIGNFGMVKRNGKPTIVVIDLGL